MHVIKWIVLKVADNIVTKCNIAIVVLPNSISYLFVPIIYGTRYYH